MVTAVNRQRFASIEIFVADDDGERFATSASHADRLHRVNAYACTCEAALAGDPVCQHRAALRFILGWLTLEDAPTEKLTTVDCGECHGRGWWYAEAMGGRVFPEKVSCRRCGGSGRMPVHIRTLAAPAALAAD